MRRAIFVIIGLSLFVPVFALAHEVYVLDGATIARDIGTISPNPLDAFFSNKYQFFFWGFICFVGFSTIFFMSIFHSLEEHFAPAFARLKKYAAPVARITLGISLLACAYQSALFGPELPFYALDPNGVTGLRIMFTISGILITFGIWTRLGAIVLLPALWLFLVERANYAPTYANYYGEVLFVLLAGGGMYSLLDDTRWLPTAMRKLLHEAGKYAWPLLRIAFGISIVYAALFAKFLHSNLALDTIDKYHLINYFHFDPLFIVLGAFIIETLIGIFFIIGVEIRWNALFFLFWLFLSLIYFGEAVWPHLILIGLNAAFFLNGYDKYSIEGRSFKKHLLEPVL